MEDQFWISELAARTGVSTRTIRYYIEEGLLPQPEIQGKYAVFSEEYIDRLNLIKLLKEAFLPLREIKLHLGRWNDAEVRQKLRELEIDPVGTLRDLGAYSNVNLNQAAPLVVKENAADYLARVMNQEQELPTAQMRVQKVMKLKEEIQPANEEAWRRITLSPGIELWLKDPLRPADRKRIQELIAFARSLFTKREERNDTITKGTNSD